MLNHWNDGRALEAITTFVDRVATKISPDYVEPEDRIAVFDNNGTLWCEKPLPIHAHELLRRLTDAAAADPALGAQADRRAAVSANLQWFESAFTKHYLGDTADLAQLAESVPSPDRPITVEQYTSDLEAFVAGVLHPTLNRTYRDCTYSPMVELVRFLEANGFTCYVVTGGGRDLMRTVSSALYGIPPDRVVGSTAGLRVQGGDMLVEPQRDVFDDGPAKPVRVFSRVGRRPILAVGNANGDLELLQYCRGLRMVISHDDADREFAYTAGAERILERAGTDGWTVVSMREDWSEVFGSGAGSGIVTAACD